MVVVEVEYMDQFENLSPIYEICIVQEAQSSYSVRAMSRTVSWESGTNVEYVRILQRFASP